jgi:hypothetical protein
MDEASIKLARENDYRTLTINMDTESMIRKVGLYNQFIASKFVPKQDKDFYRSRVRDYQKELDKREIDKDIKETFNG